MAKNEMILCDTNIFINLFKGKADVKATLDKIGNENIAFSIITLLRLFMELRKQSFLQ
jgi:predicted nucleic acid-binding protein